MKYYFLVNDRLDKLYRIIEKKFQNSTKPAYLHHSLRVANYCHQIGINENVNLETIVASALIHDIGRVTKPKFNEHVNGTREEGYKILLECGYSEKETNVIMEIALSHHPKKDELLNDIYQQILFDADNLENVGAFGIVRWYVSITSKLEYIIEDAKMYIDYFSIDNREKYFYTKFAQEKGEHLIIEGIEYAGGFELCEKYNIDPKYGANCLIVNGVRGDNKTTAALLVPVGYKYNMSSVARKELNARMIVFS